MKKSRKRLALQVSTLFLFKTENRGKGMPSTDPTLTTITLTTGSEPVPYRVAARKE